MRTEKEQPSEKVICIECGRLIREEVSYRFKKNKETDGKCELDCYTDYEKNEPDIFISGQQ